MADAATCSLPEAAAALGISQWLAYELVKRGEFPVPVLKLGRRLRVSNRQLHAFIEGDGTAVAS
jgi:excisionase family DNA binding protein